jgi:hypothetical protein
MSKIMDGCRRPTNQQPFQKNTPSSWILSETGIFSGFHDQAAD